MYSPFSYLMAACALCAGTLGGLYAFPGQERYFMTVHDVRQVGDKVEPVRTIHGTATRPYGQSVIADWRVTVVPVHATLNTAADLAKGAPTCQTIPGPNLHDGWSRYTPDTGDAQAMHFDVWVGDPGCWDRLPAGQYVEYTTWTPRDGSRPVWWKREFTKD